MAGEPILVGTTLGKIFLIENGILLNTWHLSDEDVHWFEPLSDDVYLVAGDSRQVIRLDTSGYELPLIGPIFAEDDVEHIVYDKATNQAFASSFDRNIYVIDPRTCKPIRKLWAAPFKCRWVYVFKSISSTLIVQCRNGGLYKINTLTSEIISEIKETPNSLWSTSKSIGGKIFIAGEGNRFAELTAYNATTSRKKMTGFSERVIDLNTTSKSYTKRLAANRKDGMLAFGRTDGELLTYIEGKSKTIAHLNSAIRDLEFDTHYPVLYIACEDGNLMKLSTSDGSVLNCWHSQFPLWTLALNEKRGILATSERQGKLIFIDLETFLPIKLESRNTYSKRMKWISDDILIYGSRNSLHKYNFNTSTSYPYVKDTGNSIEDFDWDSSRKYLVMINYDRTLFLCDYLTGNILDAVSDQIDFSHGVNWVKDEINKSGDPNEFFTFGRTGEICFYKVYEDRIISTGNFELSI